MTLSGIKGLTKEQIRSKILFKLKTQKEEERKRKSKIIKEKVFKTPEFKKAKRVMFYVSFDGEVETKSMIKEAQKLGKIVAVPVCTKERTLKPCLLNDQVRLKRGPYGIAEPAIQRLINVEDLDLIIVPAVAFDKKGNRLGRGKGYYDRFLKKAPQDTKTFGLAFGFQILPFLPATPEDVGVQQVFFA